MDEPNKQENIQITDSFKMILQDKDSFFQIVDLFPIPIAIFLPDGMNVFVNSTFLESFNIGEPDKIVGKLNVRSDTYFNKGLGLTEYLQRVFAGEFLSVHDIKVPFKEINTRYVPDKSKYTEMDMYQNITCFPIRDEQEKIVYIISLFITKQKYFENIDILKAKEYIETHWLEKYDMDKVSNSVNISRYHFARLFKRYTGMTPYSYYKDIKIKKLKDALCNENNSISEAFISCGVDYGSNYSKIFKDITGMTPSQYRNIKIKKGGARISKEQEGSCNEKQTVGFEDIIIPSLQPISLNEELLFQVVDLFPIPIQIFTPDGDIIFINQAVLKAWNISDSSHILGKYNLIEDSFVNDQFGLKEYICHIFQGEIVLIPDIRLPLEDFWIMYKSKDNEFDIESIYTDILNFPIYNTGKEIIYIVSVFLTTRIYQGKSDIERAKEFMDNNWLEDFDIDKIAGNIHFSRYHFIRRFKKHTGMTPYSYYQDLKVGKLKDALRDKNISITEAFELCGVKYNGNFAKVFKARVGMTPSEYHKIAMK